MIAVIYIVIATGIAGGIIYSKTRPTCTDGKQDGKEEGVDCGILACGKACAPAIQPLQIQSAQIVKTLAGDDDLALQVLNPNSNYGVADGEIEVTLGSTDLPIDFYMLPGQTKYLVQTALKGIPAGTTPQAAVKSVNWEKVDSSIDNPFVVSRDAVTPGQNQTTYQAVISNNSNYDFNQVDVGIVVTDNAGNLIATSTTNLQTFLSQTERSIQAIWPFALPVGAVIKTEVGTNIFNNDNYIKAHGSPQQFQQYY